MASRLLLTGFTFIGAVLHVLPIARPFLAPFKGAIASFTNFGWKAILHLRFHEKRLLCVVN